MVLDLMYMDLSKEQTAEDSSDADGNGRCKDERFAGPACAPRTWGHARRYRRGDGP